MATGTNPAELPAELRSRQRSPQRDQTLPSTPHQSSSTVHREPRQFPRNDSPLCVENVHVAVTKRLNKPNPPAVSVE